MALKVFSLLLRTQLRAKDVAIRGHRQLPPTRRRRSRDQQMSAAARARRAPKSTRCVFSSLAFNPFNEKARFSLLLRAMSRSSIFSISLVAPSILYAPLQLPLLEPPPLFSLASLVSLSVSSASPLPRSLLTTIKPFVFTSQIHHPPGHLSVVL